MELNLNPNVGAVARSVPAMKAIPSVKAQQPAKPNFAAAEALEAALRETPDVRTDSVERARRLAADPNYPSAQGLDRLARLLAGGLKNGRLQ